MVIILLILTYLCLTEMDSYRQLYPKIIVPLKEVMHIR